MTNLIHSQISSSTAASCKVKTARDESVGSIKDIMINTQTGQVSYVVLKVDEGFLNLGSKLLALPWQSFEFNTAQDKVVIVKETKETLENSPGFDEENWPTGPQVEFIHSMRSYYSLESRSLYGKYNPNETRLPEGLSTSEYQNTIKDREFGDGFLEPDHRGDRQVDRQRGGNSII